MTKKNKYDALFSKRPSFQLRAVHLDLKGTPPKPKQLIQLLTLFARAKYNVVLVEWENMFPWNDKQFRASNAYTLTEINEFLKVAKYLGLEIIPLVQTLGHMETFLAPPKYKHLRERPDRCDVLNPLAKGAQQFAQSIINEIIEKMPDIKHIHIGGDEAWTFGTHPETKQYIKMNGKADLYLYHMLPLLNKIIETGVRPMIWHDMIQQYDTKHLTCLKNRTDVAIWGYADSPYDTKHHYNLNVIQKFCKLGFNVWGATAYKGAEGSTSDLPNIFKRRTNALAWVQVGKACNFKGMIATAWGRYSALWPQCEPIYGALDSLLYIGMLIYNGKMPKCDIEDCRTSLKGMPEALLFSSTYDALKELSQARKLAWEQLWWITHQVALEKYDAKFRSSEAGTLLIESMDPILASVEKACKQTRKILVKSIDAALVDEYLTVRIDALRLAFDKLKNDVYDIEKNL